MSEFTCLKIHITGIVQGVGFRPFVYSLAMRMDLKGWVRNTSAGVDIEIEGTEDQLAEFVSALKNENPPLSKIDSFTKYDCPLTGFSKFEILHSEPIPGAFIPISPDVSICDDCLREMHDPTDRRYLYPFINCTNCGPRFTIIEDIPYDRPNTTMAQFEMCDACRTEYEDPFDRRFHAQPVACPECGPHVWLENSNQSAKINPHQNAITAAQGLLIQGKILAIKGLGGFHLACDATNSVAVAELRRRKLRVDKPFALMMPDIESVEVYCNISIFEREMLLSRQRPILLLDKKTGISIAPAVAPNQKTLGVMLPYTPLHYLLFGQQPKSKTEKKLLALVMTSGNLSEEPIAYTNEDARKQLSSLADVFLLHDRDIRTRCDDSVYRVINRKSYTTDEERKTSKFTAYPLRRSRGYAPNPIHLPWKNVPQILATGPELKNTFCLTKDNYAFLSHHIGDMENYETLQSFQTGIQHFERLFRIEPEAIACDMHPNYLATRYAQERAQSTRIPIIFVQHHHAHIAACMTDNNLIGNKPVIGVSFDGTGYGDDSAIWGGEFLLADYAGYQRFAHLKYSPLPGGDAAIRKPARIALAQLWQAGLEWDEDLKPIKFLCGDDLTLLRSMLENNINCPLTSSIGRLFDAVSALSGVRGEINYEGQAAIELEGIANPDLSDKYNFEFVHSHNPQNGSGLKPILLDAAPVFHEIISDLHKGIPIPNISGKFHNSIANVVVKVCEIMRQEFNINEVILSGGVWQNKLLLKKSLSLLERSDFLVYIHQQVPTNDGGLALGQAAIAVWNFRQ
ncbi:MAG: carbamoyltransferase HypF [Anaerolineales bacterium]